MHIPYRHSEKIKLNQYTKAPLKNQIDAARVVLVLLPEKPGKADWAQLAYGDTLKSRYQQLKRQDKQASLLITDLPNKTGTRVILQTLTAQSTTYRTADHCPQACREGTTAGPGYPAATGGWIQTRTKAHACWRP